MREKTFRMHFRRISHILRFSGFLQIFLIIYNKLFSTSKMSNSNTKSFFDEPDSHRTLGLTVENRTFWVPRDTLAAYSPVFKKMLYGEFKEANQDIITLPEKKADEIHELLCCLIPSPDVKDIDYTNVGLILAFSDEYDIFNLRRRAEQFLRADMKDRENGDEALLRILLLASKYKMRRLLPQCVRRCGVEFSLQKLRPIFQYLRTEVIAGVLEYMAARGFGVSLSEIDKSVEALLNRM